MKLTVAYHSDMFIKCEGDERPSEEQRADPIASEGLLNFQKKKLQQADPLMFVLKSQIDPYLARL